MKLKDLSAILAKLMKEHKVNKLSKFIKLVITGSLLFLSVLSFSPIFKVKALENGNYVPALSVSPMAESIVLNPGDTYSSSIKVSYPQNASSSTHYKVAIQPFYVDENYNNVYEKLNNYSLIVDWVNFDSPETDEVKPGEIKEIYYTFRIPSDAPAGGQYFAITVASDTSEAEIKGDAINVTEILSVSHLVFVEITGTTIRQGDITSINVPSFILSGDVSGSSTIKNTGNVHSDATYKLQVFPLFSNEEVYTNEEKPDIRRIMPDRSFYNETIWSDTPAFGIFNVVYTVEFEGVTQQVSKMVIKCPIWLLFIIIFIIAAIIIYFVVRAKSRKNSRKRIETE